MEESAAQRAYRKGGMVRLTIWRSEPVADESRWPGGAWTPARSSASCVRIGGDLKRLISARGLLASPPRGVADRRGEKRDEQDACSYRSI